MKILNNHRPPIRPDIDVRATMLGVPAEDAHLFDPRVLRAAVKGGL